jgi:predicted nuclease of predicted toxin-antitoxin system
MNFKIDENLPVEAAQVLRQAGHDAKLAVICRREQRALITFDKDFADIRTYPPSEYNGLVVIRLPQQDKPSVLALMKRLLPILEQEVLAQKLWIVDMRRVRIRE